MSSLFKRLSAIDEITKDTVNGWIRFQQQELNLCHVPMMLCSICILYYHNDEIFDIIGNNVKVSKNKKGITKINKYDWNNTSYGINQISLNSGVKYKYQWDIKIMIEIPGINFFIGLSSGCSPSKGCEVPSTCLKFMYCSDGDLLVDSKDINWKEYGRPLDNNDIVSILLDLREMEIRFFVNGIDQGIAYNVTISDEKLRLSVTMYPKSTSVEIVKFSKQK